MTTATLLGSSRSVASYRLPRRATGVTVRSQRNPTLRSARAQRDERLTPHIERVWQANLQVYGADKVWRQLNRESIAVARCTVERLMRLWDCAVYGVARSYERRFRIVPSRVQRTRSIGSSRPTVPINYGYPTSPISLPGRAGFNVAFVIDVFARPIVG